MKIWHRYLIVLLTALVAGGAAYAYYQHDFQQSSGTDLARVRTTVSGFGDQLFLVNLLAPTEILTQAMDEHYALYIHPELLASWKADPKTALGRLTSSPYPDRIDVANATENPDGTYTVDAFIVEKVNSTTTPVSLDRVRFILTKGPDGWQITSYEKVPQ